MPLIQETHGKDQQNPSEDSQRLARIRIKNRRTVYLQRHPSYFASPDLELADPLLYDRCVRRFQSATEREIYGRSKGYSGVLEADLYRSEAKVAALAGVEGQSQNSKQRKSASQGSLSSVSYMRSKDGEILPEDPDEVPRSKEDGFERWKFEMTAKFLNGEDPDFPYQEVDENEELDIIENKEAEERWFEDEEPEWVGEGQRPEILRGETGIQDF